MTPGADAIVVGGGVIGAAVALALGERGARVVLVDAGGVSGEASRAPRCRPPASAAAAGILGAQMEAHADGALTQLCLASRSRFAAFAEHLEAKSDVAIEHRTCGVIVAAPDAAELQRLDEATAWQRDAGLRVERLDAGALREAEPAIAESSAGAMRFPDDARVDPRALLRGLHAALPGAGGVLLEASATRVISESDRVVGVETDAGPLRARTVVLCAGSWSPLVDGARLRETDVVPARGQMLELRARPGLLRSVVLGPHAYLSPRDDGRVLVGSTVELAGFDDAVTASAARDLLAGAIRLAPALAEARLADRWAGLRPRTGDELPLIGPLGPEGLVLATGHFRNGVLLAPITADCVAALVERRPPPVDLAPFAPARLASLG